MSGLYLSCYVCKEKHKANVKHFPFMIDRPVYNKTTGETKKVPIGYLCRKCTLKARAKKLGITVKKLKGGKY